MTVFVPIKNGFNAVVSCCLPMASQRSKVPLVKKTITLTVCVNEALRFTCIRFVMIRHFSPSYRTLTLAQSSSAAQHPTKSCSQTMATAACTTDCTYIKQSMDRTQRKSLGMILVVKITIKLKNFNGVITLAVSRTGTLTGTCTDVMQKPFT